MKLSTRFIALALGFLAAPAIGNAQVLDLGDGGSFANAISPSNVTRVTGAFWDNHSDDRNLGTGENKCNVGFFAVGTLDAGCNNQAAGTGANQGGFVGGSYWGSTTVNAGGNRDAAAFMFSGAYGYNLRLAGSIAERKSEIGWFTIDPRGSYIFNPIADFGNRVVNSTASIASGQDWGLYIRNSFNLASGGCLSSDYDCSNASGGYSGTPFQQFVLMTVGPQGIGARYLVGVEDQALNLSSGHRDSDYQDYLIEITATAVPEPMSMVLMATGLVGLAGAGLLRRRRDRNNA